jgi:hypothetical protein
MEICTKVKKYWNDPVLSKVIAAGVIFIITMLWLLVKSIYWKIPFKQVFNQLIDILKESSNINNAILILCGLLLIVFVVSFVFRLRQDIQKKKNQIIEAPIVSTELPTITEQSTVFFSDRLSKAFPGQRGIQWYEPKQAVERLKIVFQDPIKFNPEERFYGCMVDPIWWLRGGSALFIQKFKALSKTKVLLGHDEIEIKRIAVNVDKHYYKCFIYVEAKAEKQTGFNNYTKEDIKTLTNEHGYWSEEYGLHG